MAEHTRKDPRAKVLSMTVRYRSATLDEFIEHHSHDVSRGGMYIKTPQPFPAGTLLKFEVKIAADQKVIQGVGRVVWRREADDASADHPAGMGVKFIKLDEESKNTIDQLVTARTDDISAFDEVEPQAEAAQPTGTESPAGAAKPAETEGFFPKSTDDFPKPAPEDRTVMKQATELLQEALREVGTAAGTSEQSAPNDAVPKAPKGASATPGRTAQLQAQAPAADMAPRVQRVPVPVVPGAKVESRSSAGQSPAAASHGFEPMKIQGAHSAPKQPASDVAPKTVPATPMAARRAVAQPQPALARDEYKIPTKAASSSARAMRVGITLALVGAAAALVVALSHKSERRPEPQPSPLVQKNNNEVQAAPVVLNLVQPASSASAAASVATEASAAPAPSEAPSAAATPSTSASAPAASESAKATEATKAAPTSKVRQPVVRPRKPATSAAATAAAEPGGEAPTSPTPKPASTETSGSSEATPPAATPPASAKSKPKPATPAPTPAPAAPADESPL
jgi:uncharacterized protein (TIGR02266 family)